MSYTKLSLAIGIGIGLIAPVVKFVVSFTVMLVYYVYLFLTAPAAPSLHPTNFI